MHPGVAAARLLRRSVVTHDPNVHPRNAATITGTRRSAEVAHTLLKRRTRGPSREPMPHSPVLSSASPFPTSKAHGLPGQARGTLVSPGSPGHGFERAAQPVTFAHGPTVTGVPLRTLPFAVRTEGSTSPTSFGLVPKPTPWSSTVFASVRGAYVASMPSFREAVVFLATVGVLLFAVALAVE